ncbi:MAG: hypothetical protein Kow00124_15690 [Anaerolineae bacterium]
MQYGISVPNFGPYHHPRALAGLAREAEDAGWDGFFVWDHIAWGDAPLGDPWIALAAIAMTTERLRIGPLITPLPRRRPQKAARETVSLDHLSGGRVVLGVGTGGHPDEWALLGDEADARTRGMMLDEALELLTLFWRGEPFTFEGAYYRAGGVAGPTKDQAQFLPRPVQQPRIPVWVGGKWPNRPPFRRAARWDGVVPMRVGVELGQTIAPEDVRELVRYTLDRREGAGPFDVVISGQTGGRDRAADAARVSLYEDAGATWWVETIDPWSRGWDGRGGWPLDAMRARVLAGPPI